MLCNTLWLFLIEKGYIPIIAVNKKNKKFNNRKLSNNEKEKYKKRIKIEHTNKNFKDHRRCNCRYDRNLDSFYGSTYVSLIDNILKHIE